MAEDLPAPPWRVAAALAVTQVIHWGSLFYAFSVLMPAMMAETGWRVELVVGAFSAGLLAEAGAAVLVGVLLDRLGARRVMTAGSLAAALGLWLAGKVETPWQLYAVWIALGATMAATLYQSAFAAITASFGAHAARRGIAAVAFAGGLASTVFWPLTSLLVQSLGWREACSILALLNLACVLPHLLIPASTPPASPGARGPAAGPHLPLRQHRFWILVFVYAVIGFASSTVAVHLVPFLQERGLGASAAFIASLVGVAQVAGRIAEFAGGGRISLRSVALLSLATLGIVFGILAVGGDAVLLGCAVVFYGAANGVLTIVRGALPALLFGAEGYGTITGILSAGSALARAAGPIGMAWMWQKTDGYAAGMAVIALLYFAAIIALAIATRSMRSRPTAREGVAQTS
ncbi:MFS transporter [Roseomonas xinghualingensis]|uniref:MFS transporter n=1 Tax=Roseomonas xinghualingensis TaxID=2986475 RepID=UPI0021F247CB|nr:MFS transporter [Roseomonas sp. SXEYE001]MCV4209256.1 MFS transporter [Roseomonas sp. SXEYE001]